LNRITPTCPGGIILIDGLCQSYYKREILGYVGVPHILLATRQNCHALAGRKQQATVINCSHGQHGAGRILGKD